MKTPTECAYCGAVFEARRSDAKYCGVRCRVAAHRARRGAASSRSRPNAGADWRYLARDAEVKGEAPKLPLLEQDDRAVLIRRARGADGVASAPPAGSVTVSEARAFLRAVKPRANLRLYRVTRPGSTLTMDGRQWLTKHG